MDRVISAAKANHKKAGRMVAAPEEAAALHASCMGYIRDRDVSMLVWDMMDARPNEYELGWAVHPVIYAFGVALVDNALLQPLAEACAEEGRYEFLLVVAPLRVPGGTGSPVNPLVIF